MSAELKLSCALSKDHVKTAEEAVLHVELTNAGSAPQAVNSRLGLSLPRSGGDVHLEIRDRAGKEVGLSTRINIGRPRTDSAYRVLAPRESATREIPLGRYFPLGAGTYSIVAVYDSRYEEIAGKPVWVGTLRSNQVTLTID